MCVDVYMCCVHACGVRMSVAACVGVCCDGDGDGAGAQSAAPLTNSKAVEHLEELAIRTLTKVCVRGRQKREGWRDGRREGERGMGCDVPRKKEG